MERWSKQIALVTGASAGIGACISETLVRHGMHVIGIARNVDKLIQIQSSIKSKGLGGDFTPLKCDLRNESEIMDAFKTLETRFGGRLAVLINNAGLGKQVPLVGSQGSEAWRETFDVNVLALAIIQREAVKLMCAHNHSRGTIINISSLAGHRVPLSVGGGVCVYSASKHAVRALTEGLRREVRALPDCTIRVSMISPGVVETEFFERNLEGGKQFLESAPSLKPDDVAAMAVAILSLPDNASVDDILMRPTAQKL